MNPVTVARARAEEVAAAQEVVLKAAVATEKRMVAKAMVMETVMIPDSQLPAASALSALL